MDDFFYGAFTRRYAVFHAIQMHPDPTPQVGYGYIHVADVDALSVDDAIAVTTHWQPRAALAWTASDVQRSTSIGDLICLYESEKWWVVQASGAVRFSLSPKQLQLEWRSL